VIDIALGKPLPNASGLVNRLSAKHDSTDYLLSYLMTHLRLTF